MGERGVAEPAPTPAPEGVFQGALFYAAGRIRRGEYVAAYGDLRRALRLAPTPEDRELVRALVHLAAAGYKRQAGDERGYERQIVHAWRRLAPFVPRARKVELIELFAAVVSRGGRSA